MAQSSDLGSQRRQSAVRFVCDMLERRMLLSAPGTGWNLSFSDEFNGTAVDTTKWRMYLPWTNSISGDNRHHATNNAYASYMMPDDVNVSNGTLKLTTQKRNVTAPSGHVFNYTQGMLTSNATVWHGNGYFEIRAKIPTGGGNWPAFWTLANGWPPESDILEAWTTSGRVHQGLYNMNNAWDDYNTYIGAPTGFHTWAMEWGPGYQKYFIDGQLKYTSDNAGVPTAWQYMLLNSAVATEHMASFANANDNTFEVDYVRIYDYNASAGAVIANPDFETDGSATGWTSKYGNWSIDTANELTGARTLRLLAHASGTGAEQVITDLQPNTTYTFSGWGKSPGGETGVIGVKEYGGSQLIQTFTTNTWTRKAITFTTGAANTSARVFYFKPAGGTNSIYVDDSEFVPASTLPTIATQTAPSGGTISVPFDVINPMNGYTVSATSSNQAVLPNASLIVNGSGASKTLSVSAISVGSATVTLTLSDIFGTSVTTNFVVNAVAATVINGDQNSVGQADVFRVVRNGLNLEIYRNNNTNVPDFSFDYATGTPLAINGLDGDDSLTLDWSNGDPIPAAGLVWSGGAHTSGDTLIVSGSSGNDTASVNNDVITVNGKPFNVGTNETISLNLGSGSNSLAVPATLASRIALNVDSGSTTTLTDATGLPANTDAVIDGTLNTSGLAVGLDAISGAGSISGGGDLTVGKSNGSGTFSGSISGNRALTKQGTGTITLSGSNSFLGAITISTGNLALAHSQSGGNIANTMLISGNTATPQLQISGNILVQLAGITLDGRQTTNTTPAIRNVSGTNVLASPISLNVNGSDYRIQSDAGKLTFTGTVTNVTGNSSARSIYLHGAGDGQINGSIGNNGSTTGAVALFKEDAGTWTLRGANTFTGVTTINAGSLRAESSTALGTVGGNTFIPGNGQTGRLELSGLVSNINLLEPFNINGRATPNVAPAIVNVSGNNKLSGVISFFTGGNEYRMQADAGNLELAGAVQNATGTSSARFLFLQGAGNGKVSGVISNVSGSTGPFSVTKLNAGAWTLSAVNTFGGGTTVSEGSLIVESGDALGAGSLTIANGATTTLANNLAKALKINALSLMGSAKLDLGNNALVLDYSGASVLPSIQAAIFDAYASGTWTGAGITSTFATASPSTAAVGVAEASDLFVSYPSTYVGQSVSDVTSLVLRATRPGDANLDAQVDSVDFNYLLSNYGGTGKRWFNTDFDFSTTVNTIDFNFLAGNFGAGALMGSTLGSTPTVTPPVFGEMSIDDPDGLGLLA